MIQPKNARAGACALFATALAFANGAHAAPLDAATKAWTYQHSKDNKFLSEILSFDSLTRTVWVAGVSGVDVLDAGTGSLLQRIDLRSHGAINSVAIHNGMAAFAMEAATKTEPGKVLLFDTSTRSLVAGINSITVGAMPDMLTFTPDGSRLLVANEGTPSTYGPRLADTNGHRNYGPAVIDPVGSVSVIDMNTRSLLANVAPHSAPTSGSPLRTNTGMDFEPEYIAVNRAGTRAYVSLQEANGMGVLNLETMQFDRVIGLGAKDFSLAGNRIDPLNNGSVSFINVAAKGLYMPDGMATFERNGRTYIVMANEGDFREDDVDRSAASSVGAVAPLNALRISNTDSATGNLFAAGARSFSIRDEDGNIVFDSSETLDMEAHKLGLYDDGRSRDKGVEPEGVELMTLGGRTYAFIGLERTTQSAVAVFDITDPANSSFVRMLVGDTDVSPEGLKGYTLDGWHYLAFSNEVSNSTTAFQLTPVPEPETYALMLGGLTVVAWMRRRQTRKARSS
jgi:DNA-binding beta-propeller fold protein YncE